MVKHILESCYLTNARLGNLDRSAGKFNTVSGLFMSFRRGFGELHGALAANPPSPSSLDAPTLLATVLVFDQFSRKLFCESATAYALDASAATSDCVIRDRG